MRNLYQKLASTAFLLVVSSTVLLAQNQQQVYAIQKETKTGQLNTMSSNLSLLSQQQKLNAKKIALQKGWEIKGTTSDGVYYELMKIAPDGSPIYYQTYNKDASKSTRANTLNSGGLLNLNLDGEGMYVHVWDGGHARLSHQEYDGPGGNNRVSFGDYDNSLNDHSGHVMGTILASGYQGQAKGMAPKAYGYAFDWDSDTTEATSAASNGMILSNHSYGYLSEKVPDQYFGAYIDDSRIWDQIMYNAPYYLMVVAAGNDGGNDYFNSQPLDGYSAYDKLTGHSVSKNNLVVANLKDAEIDSQGNLVSVVRHYSSSEGPTDDYRIKPDISGNGTEVYSSSVESDYAYKTMTGTSMAAPNVTGTLLLLQQHHSNLTGNLMKAATLKGLALHTADDVASVGPDAETGWGLLNAKAAAEALSQEGSKSLIKELTLNQGQNYTTTVNASGNQPLKVSISWTDPAGQTTSQTNSHTPVLVNDLDLLVQKSSTTYYPWKLTGVTTNGKGDNNVDPFERVDISNANGQYTITVTHDGFLTNGSQNFTLIVTGINAGNDDTQSPSTPTNLESSNTTDTSTQLSWNISTDNIAVAGYEIYNNGALIGTVTGSSATINNLSPNTSYDFKVRAYDAAGNKSGFSNIITVTTTSGAGIGDYCASKANSTNDEYIQKVVLNTINYTSGKGNGYSDFTAITTDLAKNLSYTVTVTPQWSGTTYNEGYGVWIDFNQDGDFDDANENVFSKSPSKATSVSGSFVVPNNAVTGSTRMRVILKYNATPTACETTFDYGEVEDYTIQIINNNQDIEAPSKPSNLNVTGVTTNSVSLDWNPSVDNIGVEYYNVYLNGNMVKTSTTSYTTINGLAANTNYNFTVSAVDAAKNESVKSNQVAATTQNDVVAPVDYCSLAASNANYEWIKYVSFGNMTNSSSSNNGYGDYTNKVANISYGQNMIFVGAGFTSTAYTENWYVWIDLNQDGVFSNSELLLSGSSNSSSIVNGNVNIPTTALSGYTRMRVAMKFDADTKACGTFNYGEVEDYTVNISNNAGSSLNTQVSAISMDKISNENQGIVIYPNPVKNGLVNVKSKEITDGSYEILDMNGSLIKFGTFSRGTIQINVEGVSPGKYFVRISKDGRKAVKALLIQ